MPPVSKIKRDDIVEAAFVILRDEGSKGITARKLADMLKCSTHPIYQIFNNMEELYDDLYYKASEYYDAKVDEDMQGKKNIWIELGISFVKMSTIERNIYRFIYSEHVRKINDMNEYIDNDDIALVKSGLESFINIEKLGDKQIEELHFMMRVFTQGVAGIANNCVGEFEENKVREMLKKAFGAFLLQVKEDSDDKKTK